MRLDHLLSKRTRSSDEKNIRSLEDHRELRLSKYISNEMFQAVVRTLVVSFERLSSFNKIDD